jgi:hypothetical protein
MTNSPFYEHGPGASASPSRKDCMCLGGIRRPDGVERDFLLGHLIENYIVARRRFIQLENHGFRRFEIHSGSDPSGTLGVNTEDVVDVLQWACL